MYSQLWVCFMYVRLRSLLHCKGVYNLHHVENLESILSTCITSPLVSAFLVPRVRRVWGKQMEWALFRLSFLHVTSNLQTFVQKWREKNEKWRPGNKATWGTRLFQHPLSHIRSLALYLSMVQAIQCPDRTKLMLPVQSRPYFKLCNAVACARNVRMHAIIFGSCYRYRVKVALRHTYVSAFMLRINCPQPRVAVRRIGLIRHPFHPGEADRIQLELQTHDSKFSKLQGSL